MASLVENVEKVKAAHGAIKDALVAKGVAVPEGAKLTDMPALVESIEATTPNLSFWTATQSYAGGLVVPKIAIVDMTRLADLSRCFYGCSDLTSLTLPDGFGKLATNVSDCFYGCSGLTSLTFPDGFGAAATKLGRCFRNCSGLTSLTFPDGFGAAATDLSSCFSDCPGLTSLTFPDGFGAVATGLNRCFYNCSGLTSLTLPDGFGAAAAAPLSGFLSGCSSLTTLNRAPAFTFSWDISPAPLTHESLVNICTTLVDLTALATPKTLTLGSTNLGKLTDEEKAVATAKGWTLA